MKRGSAILLLPLAALLAPAPARGQSGVPAPGTAPVAATQAAQPAQDPAERDSKRSATIRYGIDTELLELFSALGAEKEGRFNGDILAVYLKTRSPKLRAAILELFRTLRWPEAEGAALDTLADRDNQDPKVVAAALAYLAEIRSKKALDFAGALLEEDDKTEIPALMVLLGRAGGPKEEDILLEWLKREGALPAFREAAIRALGEMGSKKAGEDLAKLVADPAAARFERVVAAEALGKIGFQGALASLVKAAGGEDAIVQAAAVEAMGAFSGSEAEDAVTEALRYSYPKSRIAACKAIAKMKLASALPVLEYKAANDPDKGVKVEAMRSMAAVGGSAALDRLCSVAKDPKGDAGLRLAAFGIVARSGDAGAIRQMAALLEAEALEKDRSFYTSLAKELAGAADAGRAAPLALVLLKDRDFLIRLAAVEWARAAKARDFRTELEGLAKGDPNEAVRKRAADALSLIGS